LFQQVLQLIRISIISTTLLYSSYLDWKFREVDDRVWMLSGSILLVLTILDLVFFNLTLEYVYVCLLSIGLSSGLAFLFYFLGFYGGADAKAILVVSLGLPVYKHQNQIHPFTGLSTLSNGLILSLTLPLCLACYNLYQLSRGNKIFEGFEHENVLRKFLALMFGVRLKRSKGRKFWFMMEEEKDSVRRFKFNLFSLDLNAIDRDDVWVTPGIPLLIFITAGFIYYIILGDITYYFFKFLVLISG